MTGVGNCAVSGLTFVSDQAFWSHGTCMIGQQVDYYSIKRLVRRFGKVRTGIEGTI